MGDRVALYVVESPGKAAGSRVNGCYIQSVQIDKYTEVAYYEAQYYEYKTFLYGSYVEIFARY